MEFNKDDFIVYTSLIGENEGLNKQPFLQHSGIRHVCLTDDKNLISNDWEIIYVDRIFPNDCYRSQRNFKIRPHLIFPNYKYSLYLDNTIVLKKKTDDFINMILNDQFANDKDPLFLIPYHSQFNLINEFNACLTNNLDNQIRLYEQFNDYLKTDINLFKKSAYWGGILLRNHNHKEIISLSEIWFAHICRYSRRDQLSIIHACSQSKVKLKGFKLNNASSEFHKWPITKNKRKNRQYINKHIDLIPYDIVESLSNSLQKKEKEIIALNKDLKKISLFNPIYIIKIIFNKIKTFI